MGGRRSRRRADHRCHSGHGEADGFGGGGHGAGLAFAEFELDDGAAAFAAWKGDVLAYREGNLIVSARSKGSGRFVSTSGHEVSLGNGGIRVVAPPGQVRNGRKVEPYRAEETASATRTWSSAPPPT